MKAGFSARRAVTIHAWRWVISSPGQRRLDGPGCRLGRALAAIALLLQIFAGPISHRQGALDLASPPGVLSAAFDEHALCLSGDRGASDNPSDNSPKPVRRHLALCCLWHAHAAPALAPEPNAEPVAFARSERSFALSAAGPVRRLAGAVGARAPPPIDA
jgi:hypothetical protein